MNVLLVILGVLVALGAAGAWLIQRFEKDISRSVANLVTHDLNIPSPPTIDFITECDEADAEVRHDVHVNGLCRPSGWQIYILRGLAPTKLARIVAHECRHSWQFQRKPMERSSAERDARIYEWEFMGKLGDPSDKELIRALADASDHVRSSEQQNLNKLCEQQTWEERLLQNLQRQSNPSPRQMASLAESIGRTKKEINMIEAKCL